MIFERGGMLRKADSGAGTGGTSDPGAGAAPFVAGHSQGRLR